MVMLYCFALPIIKMGIFKPAMLKKEMLDLDDHLTILDHRQYQMIILDPNKRLNHLSAIFPAILIIHQRGPTRWRRGMRPRRCASLPRPPGPAYVGLVGLIKVVCFQRETMRFKGIQWDFSCFFCS